MLRAVPRGAPAQREQRSTIDRQRCNADIRPITAIIASYRQQTDSETQSKEQRAYTESKLTAGKQKGQSSQRRGTAARARFLLHVLRTCINIRYSKRAPLYPKRNSLNERTGAQRENFTRSPIEHAPVVRDRSVY